MKDATLELLKDAPTIEIRDFHQPMIHTDRSAAGIATARFAMFAKKSIRRFLGRFSANRDQKLVLGKYQNIYGVTNEDWVRARSTRRYPMTFRGRFVETDGWFLHSIYVQIVLAWIQRLGAKSVLEVGSGRGQNLLMLALQDPTLQLKGLEYSQNGVDNAHKLFAKPPPELLRAVDLPADFDVGNRAAGIEVVQGSAAELPYADKSFDLSYTVLVLEQMPHIYEQAIAEMRRVTREYCVFIEPFREANDYVGLQHLGGKDYFRFSYETFRKAGLEPVYFSTDLPQKLRFGAGLLVARVVD